MSGPHAVVLGIGRYGSGAYTACALARGGRRVLLVDSEPLACFDGDLIWMVRACEVDIVAGGNPEWVMEGADMLYPAPSIDPGHPYVQRARSAGIPVRLDIDLLLEHADGPVFFVTGSNGKTTTAAWLHHILSKADSDAVLAGNIGVPAAKVLVSQERVRGPLVLEISSFQGRYLIAGGAGFDFLVVTNFSPNHLDHHSDIEDYRRSKRGLVPLAGKAVVLNADDEVAAWGADAEARVVSFGEAARPPCVRVTDGTAAWIAAEGKATELVYASELPVRGRHNLLNFAAAASAALAAGSDIEPLRQAARDFRGLPHRLEAVGEVGGVAFYNDSASTCPESTLAAIEAFDGGLVLIAGGRDKGFDLKAFAGHLRKAARVVLMGETSEALLGLLGGDAVSAESINDAVAGAFREAKSLGGLPVVLSPGFASFDMFDDYRDRGEAFRQEVEHLPVR